MGAPINLGEVTVSGGKMVLVSFEAKIKIREKDVGDTVMSDEVFYDAMESFD